MALSKNEWDEEYQRLNTVINKIDNDIEILEKKLKSSLKQIKQSNIDMWEQSKSFLSDMDDVVEALSFLDGINSDKMRHDNELKVLKKLMLLKKNAYFGRVDFIEKDMTELEKIYIGTSTLESKNEEILIYDWRAAISSMFYEQEKGKANFNSPAGLIYGEIKLKRQYRIFYNAIESMFESSLKIDDEILQAILSESKDNKMGIIVSSIQKEQNKAIRNESDKIVLVDGPAGSGKTSIALHRVAWLLYRYRDKIKPKNVIIYSPNEIFNDYISDVLPELGEENMRMSTFINLARSYLGNKYRFRDKYYQMEGILRNKSTNQNNAIRIKGTLEFAKRIEEYIYDLGCGLFQFEDLSYDNRNIGMKSELEHLFFIDYKTHKLALRFEKLRTLLIKRLNFLITKMRNDYIKIPRMDYERRKNAVYKARMTAKQLRVLIDRNTRPKFTTIYYNFLLKYGYKEFAIDFKKRLEKNIITYEDIAPIMLIKAHMGYKNKIKNIKHVVVDEVQDYSVVELQILTKLFQNSAYTLLGDTNQAINYLTGLNSLDELILPNTYVVKLTKSYRSTKQITEFCSNILGKEYQYEFVDRNGEQPYIKKVEKNMINSINEEVINLKNKKCQSIAIITRTAISADFIYDRVDSINIKRLHANDDTYIKGVVILPSYLAKGLEFDGVILVCKNIDNYKGEKDKKLLYTCCSRALHQLTIFYEDERPDFI